jgi:hypothetical protein
LVLLCKVWRDARVWFIGAASKAVVPQGTGGSNPPLSAMYHLAKLGSFVSNTWYCH